MADPARRACGDGAPPRRELAPRHDHRPEVLPALLAHALAHLLPPPLPLLHLALLARLPWYVAP